MPTFQGPTAPQEQPPRRSFTKSNGWVTIRSWKGDKDEIYDYAIDLAQNGGAEGIEVSHEGPVGTVEATYPDAQDGSVDGNQGIDNVEWELLGNDVEKDIKTHSSVLPTSDAERVDVIKAETYIRNPPTDDATEMATNVGTLGAKGAKLYKHLAQGTTAYVITQYVLRKTIRVARDAQVQASLSNVNKVEAPSGVPTALFNVPTEQGDSTIEWLKKPPSVRSLGHGKFSIVQEWWGATKWSDDLYDGSATP